MNGYEQTLAAAAYFTESHSPFFQFSGKYSKSDSLQVLVDQPALIGLHWYKYGVPTTFVITILVITIYSISNDIRSVQPTGDFHGNNHGYV